MMISIIRNRHKIYYYYLVLFKYNQFNSLRMSLSTATIVSTANQAVTVRTDRGTTIYNANRETLSNLEQESYRLMDEIGNNYEIIIDMLNGSGGIIRVRKKLASGSGTNGSTSSASSVASDASDAGNNILGPIVREYDGYKAIFNHLELSDINSSFNFIKEVIDHYHNIRLSVEVMRAIEDIIRLSTPDYSSLVTSEISTALMEGMRAFSFMAF